MSVFTREFDPEFNEFYRTFRGSVFFPGEPGYNESVTVFNRAIKASPELVIQPIGSIDVQKALLFVTKRGKTITVKGGGHMFSGVSISGDVVLDMCQMRSIQIDKSKCQAWVEGGARANDLDKDVQASACGLAPVNGQFHGTGIAGFTLGGGSGFLSPKYGLGCDNVLAAEVVTADGECKIISEASNPEEFWALRGAGWGLGVITRFLIRLHPIESFDGKHGYGGLMMWPQEEIPKVMGRYFELAKSKSLPDDCFLLVAVANVPVPLFEGKPAMIIQVAWVGNPSEGEEWYTKNFTGVGGIPPPAVNTCAPLDWVAIQRVHDAFFEEKHMYYLSNRYLSNNFVQEPGTESAISFVVESAKKKPDNCFFAFWAMEGMVSKRRPDDTSYAHRDLAINAIWGGGAPEDGGQEAIAQYDAAAEFIRGFIKSKTPSIYSAYMYSNLDIESHKAGSEEHYQGKDTASAFRPSTVKYSPERCNASCRAVLLPNLKDDALTQSIHCIQRLQEIRKTTDPTGFYRSAAAFGAWFVAPLALRSKLT